MNQITDREGWPLRETSRCFRFTKEGRRLRGQVIVTGLRDDGNLDVQDMKTLARGVADPARLKLIARPRVTPQKVLQYQLDRETVREASEISKRRRGDRKSVV